MNHQVIIFPRGQLASKDKERLTKAGIIAVEADDPTRVVTVIPQASMLMGDDVLMAALDGTAAPAYQNTGTFIKKLQEFARARHSLTPKPSLQTGLEK